MNIMKEVKVKFITSVINNVNMDDLNLHTFNKIKSYLCLIFKVYNHKKMCKLYYIEDVLTRLIFNQLITNI
jgi:hypothetical protein